jgi:acetolactate synthase-1/2/3 large subunit
MSLTSRSGGQILADALRLNGVERAFCVPGESYLALLDALYDSPIQVTTFRQEGGAAMAADAWGKLTGRPGIVMATRGPGATNASAGLHVARQDSTPMILLLGQVARPMREREAFQEINIKAFFGEVSKWVAEIDRAERIPEFISRAFHESTSGRPGPVVLGLPEDMLRDEAVVADALPWTQVETYPGLTQMAQLQKMFWAARNPLVILGGPRWSESAVAGMRRFAERFALPIACSFRRQTLFDNEHPNYAGDFGLGANPDLIARLKDSDLVLLVGGRMSEMPSDGYSHIPIPEPGQALVHVHPGAEELGRVYHPTLAIHASPTTFVAALEGLEPPQSIAWRDQAAAANASFRGWTTPVKNPGPVQLSEIVAWLRERLPDDAVITNGAGNYSGWLHRFYRYRRFGTQLAPTSGSMGYGMPAAIAAKLHNPNNTVVALAGDGCFQMTSQEFATAVQENAGIVVIVVNNGIHGTIRMHQERDYPNRHIATDLVDPDFAALARAHGGHGETVTRTEDFAAAFNNAVHSGKPAIIDLRFDPEAITPSRTMSQIRGSGQRQARHPAN